MMVTQQQRQNQNNIVMTLSRRLSFFVLILLAAFLPESRQQYQQQQYVLHYQQQQQQLYVPARQFGAKVLARGYSTNQNVQALPSLQAGALVPAGTAGVAASSASTCNSGGTSGTCSLTGGYDFNPALLGGQRGLAGIKARINARGFQYFSTILAPILIQQIRRARIPNINQCVPQVNGCIQVYNLYVSRFRCPQRIVLYPAPPNLVVLAIENLDIGVTGNLGGQINIILPINLMGIVQMNAHQLSARVSLTVDRAPTGGVTIRVVGCQVTVGYVDVYIENGGIIGDIANSQFRGRISEMVRSMLPSQLCNQIPSIVNEQLNGKLTVIPQSIPLSQLLQVALTSFGIGNLLGGGGGQCPCPKHKLSAAPRAPSSVFLPSQQSSLLGSLRTQPNISQLAPIHAPPVVLNRPQSALVPAPVPVVVVASPNAKAPVARISGGGDTLAHVVRPHRPIGNASGEKQGKAPKVQIVSSGNVITRPPPKRQFTTYTQRRPLPDTVDASAEFRAARLRRQAPVAQPGASRAYGLVGPPVQQLRAAPAARAAGVAVGQYNTGGGAVPPLIGGAGSPLGVGGAGRASHHAILPPPPPVPGAPVSTSGGGLGASGPTKGQLAFATPGSSPCNCPGSNSSSDSPLAILSVILTSLDFSKLSNIYLTVQYLQSYATNNDYTIELNGEFSPGGQGGTPFGAFPMQFPSPVGDKMAEILISDWTVNTLFYHLHRVGFISIRVGPETPKIGDLLKTTCSSDDEGLEDHGVETDGGDSTRRRRRRDALDGPTSINGSDVADAVSRLVSGVRRKRDETLRRVRRQDGGGSLSDLGICLGDILPAVREKYPNQKIVIHIHTARAPSVVLSARNGGTATLDFVLDADMHIQATNEKVGTIQVAATIDFTVKTSGGRISAHADITNLQLRDPSGTLGLPQDSLDNLGNLGKELLLKAGNEALEKGAPLSVPANLGGLPLTFVSPEVRIVEHALHIASDFTIDPSALSQLGLGGGGSC